MGGLSTTDINQREYPVTAGVLSLQNSVSKRREESPEGYISQGNNRGSQDA